MNIVLLRLDKKPIVATHQIQKIQMISEVGKVAETSVENTNIIIYECLKGSDVFSLGEMISRDEFNVTINIKVLCRVYNDREFNGTYKGSKLFDNCWIIFKEEDYVPGCETYCLWHDDYAPFKEYVIVWTGYTVDEIIENLKNNDDYGYLFETEITEDEEGNVSIRTGKSIGNDDLSKSFISKLDWGNCQRIQLEITEYSNVYSGEHDGLPLNENCWAIRRGENTGPELFWGIKNYGDGTLNDYCIVWRGCSEEEMADKLYDEYEDVLSDEDSSDEDSGDEDSSDEDSSDEDVAPVATI